MVQIGCIEDDCTGGKGVANRRSSHRNPVLEPVA
jgi:hypothetical protein